MASALRAKAQGILARRNKMYVSSFILRLTALVFFAELSIMMLLYVTPTEEFLLSHLNNPIGGVSIAILDSALLILLSGPPMYYWVVRPYILARDGAEQALRASEERFRSVFDNSPSAMFLKDGEGRFRLVNPQFEKWYGVSAAEVIGKTSYDVYPAKYADMFVGLEQEVLATGETREREFEIPLADGHEHTAILTKFPVRGADGRMIGVGTINTDITEHKRIEEQLRQVQKMDAVGQLTGGVAHDFNNLLTVITGSLELLEARVRRNEQRELIVQAQEAAELGASMSKHLLAFARRQPLDPKVIDLNALVLAMSNWLPRTLGETIQVITVPAEDLNKTLADPGQVENAVLNLAINARDAMPGGGTLTIKTANIELDEDYTAGRTDVSPGRYVVLSVTDTGCGIAPELKDRVFEPFFTTKDAASGAGLGLSMVYGFAKQSGGHLVLYSEPGCGTTVNLYLPQARARIEARQAPEPAAAIPGTTGETVLVVEDNTRVRQVTVKRLTDLGYVVLEAEDGKAALEVFESGRHVDLVFTDVLMPGGMTGGDLAREARHLRPGIRILFTSGYPSEAAVKRGLLDAGAELLSKPYSKTELITSVRKALDG